MSSLVKEAKIQLLEVPVEPLIDNFRTIFARRVHLAQEGRIRKIAEKESKALVDHVGQVLLTASDPDDLNEKIECLLDGHDYQRLLHNVATCSSRVSVARRLMERPAPPKDRMPNVTRIVGDQLMEICDRLMALVLKANAIATACLSEMADGDDAGPTPDAPSLGIPSEVHRAIYGHQIATLAIFGLRAADNANAEPWLICHLIDRLIGGLKTYLRLLAAFPGVTVPEDLIPLSERVDVAQLFELHSAADRGYQAALKQARRQGKNAFPPVTADE